MNKLNQILYAVFQNITLFVIVTFPIYFIPIYKVIILHETSFIRFKVEGELFNLLFLIPFVIIASFFNRKVFKVVLSICVILMALSTFIEIQTLFILDRYFATDIMYDILATNPKEAREFFHTVASNKFILKQIILILAFLLYCSLPIYAIVKMKFYQKRNVRCSYLILLLLFPVYHSINNHRTIKHILIENTATYIVNGLSNGQLLVKDNKNISSNYTAVANNPQAKQLVVFVLGESLTRNHLGLYGYHRNTTPYLQKLYDENQIYVFRNVITSEPATAISMKNIFFEEGYETRPKVNIMAVFNNAGFKNYYIENQYVKFPTKDTLIQTIDKRKSTWFYNFEIITNTMKYLANRYNAPNAKYDQAVLYSIDKILKNKDNKIFMTIHLQGSHFHYKNRYPKNFETYTKPIKVLEDMDKKSYSVFGSHVTSTNRYDTSVRYSDYVLNEIIKRINATKDHDKYEISIIFMPDHGEATARTGTGSTVGHSINSDKDVYEIPFIFWANSTFKKNHPNILEASKNNLNAPYMTDQVGFSLFHLANINLYNKKKLVNIMPKSIFSNSLNVNRIRKIGFRAGAVNGINYDTKLKPQNELYK